MPTATRTKKLSASQARRSLHPRLQLLQLAGLTITGNLLLSAIPLLTILTSAAAGWLFFTAATPVDWLAMEACTLFAVTGILASLDLLLAKPARPAGLELRNHQAPELFAMIKRRCKQFGMPPIDRVLITESAEIELIITPKRAMPGAFTQTLLIGWPLLSFLSFKQLRIELRAVIGQWAGKRAWNTGAICRQVAFWQGLNAYYANRKLPAAWLLKRPVRGFARYLASQASEISRTQIFEHDQLALEVSDDHQVLALLAAEVLGAAFLEKKYWPMIFAAAERTADPIVKPFTNLNAIMGRTLRPEEADRWLLQALAAGNNTRQSSLRERLAVLGYNALHWTGPATRPAMETLFGQQWQTIAGQLDNHWQDHVKQEWTDRHWRFRQDQDQFYSLQQQAARENITGATAIRYARLAEQFLTREEMVALCKRLLRVNRTHADVCFQCGKQMLAAGNDDGIRAIEIAIQLDPNYTNQGNTLIYAFERTNRVIPFQQVASA